jgi:nitroreductase
MNTIRTITRRRRSCRDFADKPLARERVDELINDSVWVPSGSNNQPWRFVVITDRERMKRYSDASKNGWLQKIHEYPHMEQYVPYMKDPYYNVFYNAPVLIVIYGDKDSYWHVYDCTMVAHNLHLLAEESGLGCCWIGFAHNIFSDPEIKLELSVPQNFQLVAPVILGYPASKDTASENPNQRKTFEITYL